MPAPASPWIFALALACCGSVATHAHQLNTETDQMARWLAQIDRARQLAVPPPPEGVRETRWNELSPAGWNPGKILQRLEVSKVSGSDPRAREIETQILREWDNAPTVPMPTATPIRLTGYPLMSGDAGGLAKTIVLVPYHGSGIHRPPAPANQRVMVFLKNGVPRNMGETPIWVTGTLHPLATPTVFGRVGYTMTDATWQKYPVATYPLPSYNPLH